MSTLVLFVKTIEKVKFWGTKFLHVKTLPKLGIYRGVEGFPQTLDTTVSYMIWLIWR